MDIETVKKATTLLLQIREKENTLNTYKENGNILQLQLIDESGGLLEWVDAEMTNKLIKKSDVMELLEKEFKELKDEFKAL